MQVNNVCEIYWFCGRLAANTLIEVQEFCNGTQIYLDQYDVTGGKQDMIWKHKATSLCDLTGTVYDHLQSFPPLLLCLGLAQFEIEPGS